MSKPKYICAVCHKPTVYIFAYPNGEHVNICQPCQTSLIRFMVVREPGRVEDYVWLCNTTEKTTEAQCSS